MIPGELFNPYPGLRPFEQEESHLFFGRDGQVDEIIARLKAERFVALVGVSGCGKSSLIRAGLLPSLHLGRFPIEQQQWRVAVALPGQDPYRNLAEALARAGVLEAESNGGDATGGVETILRRSGFGIVEAVRRTAALSKAEEPTFALLVLIDQFEELFHFAREKSPEDAHAYVELLLEAVGQRDVPVYVVMTMRSDFLGDCSRFRALPEMINRSQYLVPRMSRDQLKSAVTGPAELYGVSFSPRLSSRILNDSGDNPDRLPLLQHALARCWEKWKQRTKGTGPVDLEDYQEAAEISGPAAEAVDTAALRGMDPLHRILNARAEEIYHALAREQRSLAEKVFRWITELGPGGREIRRPATLETIARAAFAPLNGNESWTPSTEEIEEVRALADIFRSPEVCFLRPLAPAPLLADTLIDITHESLIRCWTTLRRWLLREAMDAADFRMLSERASKGGELLTGKDLIRASAWKKESEPTAIKASRWGGGFEETMRFLLESAKAEAETVRKRKIRETLYVITFWVCVLLGIWAWVERNSAKKAEGRAETAAAEAIVQQKAADAAKKAAERANADATKAKEQIVDARADGFHKMLGRGSEPNADELSALWDLAELGPESQPIRVALRKKFLDDINLNEDLGRYLRYANAPRRALLGLRTEDLDAENLCTLLTIPERKPADAGNDQDLAVFIRTAPRRDLDRIAGWLLADFNDAYISYSLWALIDRLPERAFGDAVLTRLRSLAIESGRILPAAAVKALPPLTPAEWLAAFKSASGSGKGRVEVAGYLMQTARDAVRGMTVPQILGAAEAVANNRESGSARLAASILSDTTHQLPSELSTRLAKQITAASQDTLRVVVGGSQIPWIGSTVSGMLVLEIEAVLKTAEAGAVELVPEAADFILAAESSFQTDEVPGQDSGEVEQNSAPTPVLSREQIQAFKARLIALLQDPGGGKLLKLLEQGPYRYLDPKSSFLSAVKDGCRIMEGTTLPLDTATELIKRLTAMMPEVKENSSASESLRDAIIAAGPLLPAEAAGILLQSVWPKGKSLRRFGSRDTAMILPALRTADTDRETAALFKLAVRSIMADRTDMEPVPEPPKPAAKHGTRRTKQDSEFANDLPPPPPFDDDTSEIPVAVLEALCATGAERLPADFALVLEQLIPKADETAVPGKLEATRFERIATGLYAALPPGTRTRVAEATAGLLEKCAARKPLDAGTVSVIQALAPASRSAITDLPAVFQAGTSVLKRFAGDCTGHTAHRAAMAILSWDEADEGKLLESLCARVTGEDAEALAFRLRHLDRKHSDILLSRLAAFPEPLPQKASARAIKAVLALLNASENGPLLLPVLVKHCPSLSPGVRRAVIQFAAAAAMERNREPFDPSSPLGVLLSLLEPGDLLEILKYPVAAGHEAMIMSVASRMKGIAPEEFGSDIWKFADFAKSRGWNTDSPSKRPLLPEVSKLLDEESGKP